MIAYFYPCFSSKTLENNLEAQNRSAEQLIAKHFFQNLCFCYEISMAACEHSLKRSPW